MNGHFAVSWLQRCLYTAQAQLRASRTGFRGCEDGRYGTMTRGDRKARRVSHVKPCPKPGKSELPAYQTQPVGFRTLTSYLSWLHDDLRNCTKGQIDYGKLRSQRQMLLGLWNHAMARLDLLLARSSQSAAVVREPSAYQKLPQYHLSWLWSTMIQISQGICKYFRIRMEARR